MKLSDSGAALAAATLLFCDPAAYAHGGGTNADGCHTNRKSGDYHCHGAKRAPAYQPPPANSLHGAQPARSDDVYYANCTEAREAGAAPVRRGDPGYASHLDGDNDGVGCE